MIELHINGSDLMVNGHFDAWQSRLTMGPDLDKLGLQLAIDATSVGSGLAPDSTTGKLFSFESHNVAAVASGMYRATGQFQGAGSEAAREMELQLEVSTEHTPTFVISFNARKDEFGDGWTRLIESVAPVLPANDIEGPVRAAQAWLTPPELAAA